MQQQAAEFGIDDARRVLGEVFAPWIIDLNLSIEAFDFAQSSAADWQPGAVLRLPFSERLCRNGGTVCGQALMAFADTAMVIANLAANRAYRPMTTVDQTTARGDRFRRARGCPCGAARPHHEFWSRHAFLRHRQQAGGDGLKRLCDAAVLKRLQAKWVPVRVKKTRPGKNFYLPRMASAALTMLIDGFFAQ